MARTVNADMVGSYVLRQRLGVGGMAEVFLATAPDGRNVAIKRVLPALAVDEEFRAMFWDEACIMAELNHANIVRLFDYGQTKDTLYLALEYVDGPSVARYLRKAARDKLAPKPSAAVSIIVQLLAGLGYVHAAVNRDGDPLNIVHRDVSPGNLLLSQLGQAKLGDFGIVRSEFLARRTQPGELKGKMGYMSPEQAEGFKVDRRSDLFSAGIILAELLTLRPLFLGKSEFDTLTRTVRSDLSTWHRFNHSVPPPLREVTEKALRRDVNERYQSADEMMRALREAAEESGVPIGRDEVAKELGRTGLLAHPELGSGERPRVVLGPSVAPRSRSSAPPSERDQRWVPPESFRPGRSVWRAEYHEASLPLHLFSALSRVTNGGVELKQDDRSLYLEIHEGRIIAAHDSSSPYQLGRLLIEENVMSKGELDTVLMASRTTGQRLGQSLASADRLREGVLGRVLSRQFRLRLSAWMKTMDGRISALSHDGHARDISLDPPESIAQVVEALREIWSTENMEARLQPVLESICLPAGSVENAEAYGFSPGEWRALRTVLPDGALEGKSIGRALSIIVEERLARKREAQFAILIGLSAGLIQAPGFAER